MEAITDTIHEYMYEKMNESKDSEEETKIKHEKNLPKILKGKTKQIRKSGLY